MIAGESLRKVIEHEAKLLVESSDEQPYLYTLGAIDTILWLLHDQPAPSQGGFTLSERWRYTNVH